jgi:hypothetical protein
MLIDKISLGGVMRAPESHHETESMLQPKTEASEVPLVTPGDGGNGGVPAKLGIPRQTLESKIRKLGINRHRFKTS